MTIKPPISPQNSKPNEFMHTIPPDLQDAVDSVVGLQAKWDKLTPLAQNEWICWVTIIKKPETRLEHITRLSEDLLKGKKRPCCWPGCPHRRPSAAKYFNRKEKN